MSQGNREVIVKMILDASGAITGAERVEEAITKVEKKNETAAKGMNAAWKEARGGVIGLVNDLTGGLASKFMDVKDSIGLATTGMKGFKAALIATGVGALIVGIGTLISYSEELSTAVLDGATNMNELNAQSKKAAEASQALQDAWGLEERRLRALGTADAEILAQRKESIKAQIQQAKLSAQLAFEAAQKTAEADKILEKQGARGGLARWWLGTEEKAAENKKNLEDSLKRLKDLEVTLLETDKAIADDKKKAEEKATADAKAAADERKRINEQAAQDRIKRSQAEAEAEVEGEKKKIEAIGMARIEAKQTIAVAEIKVDTDIVKRTEEEIGKVLAETEEQRRARRMREYLAEVELNKARVNFTIASLNEIASVTESFAGRNEKSQRRAFGVQKALSAAAATINTLQAITGVFKSAAANPSTVLFPGYPYVQAGIMAASGFAQVKKILAQQYGGGASGGGGSVGGGGSGGGGGSFGGGGFGGVNAPQPMAPTLPSLTQPTSQPVHAYVLAGNVVDSTEARAKISRQARL